MKFVFQIMLIEIKKNCYFASDNYYFFGFNMLYIMCKIKFTCRVSYNITSSQCYWEVYCGPG